MNGGGWEGLDMSTICLDMFLGLPPLKWPVGVVFIGSNPPPPPYSCWTESSSFSVDGPTGQSSTHRTQNCSVSGAYHISRPLESTVGFVCPGNAPDSLVRLTFSDLLSFLIVWQSCGKSRPLANMTIGRGLTGQSGEF
jgi:hypothetical protein